MIDIESLNVYRIIDEKKVNLSLARISLKVKEYNKFIKGKKLSKFEFITIKRFIHESN